MPALIRPPLKEARSRIFDSARWAPYSPRPDDIIIGTYSKCGTTWMQRIVGMLIFQDTEPRPVSSISHWPDARFALPLETMWALAEAQTRRRFFKSHLPLDLLPLYESVKYIHVARDGRDAALSLHNHISNFTADALAKRDEISLHDPKYGDRYPRAADEPAAFFHDWVKHDHAGNAQDMSFFQIERSYWHERRRENVLLVHYNDLKADRESEMKRIAAFLGIEVSQTIWPDLIEAAGFDAMKRASETIVSFAKDSLHGGGAQFLNKGTIGRWREVFSSADLAAYDARIKAEFTPALAHWVEQGRRIAGDPRAAPD